MLLTSLVLASALLGISNPASVCAAAVRRQTSGTPLPDFVTQFAPISHLFSNESWFPSDVATHLQHVTPKNGTKPVANSVSFDTIEPVMMLLLAGFEQTKLFPHSTQHWGLYVPSFRARN